MTNSLVINHPMTNNPMTNCPVTLIRFILSADLAVLIIGHGSFK